MHLPRMLHPAALDVPDTCPGCHAFISGNALPNAPKGYWAVVDDMGFVEAPPVVHLQKSTRTGHVTVLA